MSYSDLHVAIVQFDKEAPSETFLYDQRTRLPCRVSFIYGDIPRLRDHFWNSNPRWISLRQRLWSRQKSSVNEHYLKLFRSLRPDVVLAQFGPMGCRVQAACEQLGIPLAVYFHGYDASMEWVLRDYEQAYQKLWRGAAGIIVVSRAMRQKLISLGADPSKVWLNYCGVDLEQFKSSKRIERREKVILAVSRIVEKKGIPYTLQSFALLRKSYPNANLRIVGEGTGLQYCQGLSRELGIEAYVHFLGVGSREEVKRELQGADIFVQHSVVAENGDSEGSPVSISEAGAMALPVVATFHGGIPDIIINGKTGFLVPERDVEGMAAYLELLCRDGDLRKKMGEAARGRINDSFNQKKTLDSLVQLLNGFARNPSIEMVS